MEAPATRSRPDMLKRLTACSQRAISDRLIQQRQLQETLAQNQRYQDENQQLRDDLERLQNQFGDVQDQAGEQVQQSLSRIDSLLKVVHEQERNTSSLNKTFEGERERWVEREKELQAEKREGLLRMERLEEEIRMAKNARQGETQDARQGETQDARQGETQEVSLLAQLEQKDKEIRELRLRSKKELKDYKDIAHEWKERADFWEAQVNAVADGNIRPRGW